MYKFQICARNEYGDVSIFSTANDIFSAQEEARKQVTTMNDNSLTSDEKLKNYEAFFVEIDRIYGKDGNFIYAGRDGHGKDIAFDILDDSSNSTIISKADVSIFIGLFEKVPTYANDIKGRPIRSLTASELNGRTAIYIRKV